MAHRSRTDGRTEPLSDNLGRMTKLLGPEKQRQQEGEVERTKMYKRKMKRNRRLQMKRAGCAGVSETPFSEIY